MKPRKNVWRCSRSTSWPTTSLGAGAGRGLGESEFLLMFFSGFAAFVVCSLGFVFFVVF